jgi:hypothetical protein
VDLHLVLHAYVRIMGLMEGTQVSPPDDAG